MINLLAQYNFKVNKPICPTLIHDDTTRLILCFILIPVLFYISYRIIKNFDGPR